MKITRHLRIEGRVQGVGYRDALRTAARAGGITGWVRNRRDGTVEAVVQGSPEAVAIILAWAKHGPPAARVTDVSASAASGEFERHYGGFELLPTA
jgi:acylphosphatase